jgi:hypothetical protein
MATFLSTHRAVLRHTREYYFIYSHKKSMLYFTDITKFTNTKQHIFSKFLNRTSPKLSPNVESKAINFIDFRN